jgi:hypothetical protein
MTQSEVQLRSITRLVPSEPIMPFTDKFVQAGWNYYLIRNDSSKGIHNPDFAREVLEASITALK